MSFMFRVAQLLELKYNLKAEGAPLDYINDIKRDIINCYNLYLNSDKAKDPILQMLANNGEPFSKELVSSFEDLVANLNEYSLEQIFNRIRKIINMIADLKMNPQNPVRSFIHDSVRVTKESERNYREHLKSKFENVIVNISGILEKKLKVLQKFVPNSDNLSEYSFEPRKKELSKARIYRFIKNQADISGVYGLDSLEAFERLLFYPDLKNRITTLINAVDRGKIPQDGPEVKSSINEIMKDFRLKTEKDNSSLFGEQKE